MEIEKELSPHAVAALTEIERCTSCGLCKDVCPVFALSRREAESPRGKINLLRALMDEDLDPTPEAVDIFNRCLLCYACQDVCPAGVRTERIWISAREILADEVGRPLLKSFFLRRILTQSALWNLSLGLARRFPGSADSLKLKNLLLPRPAADRLQRLLPEIAEPDAPAIGTVAFFPGCLIADIFPHIGLKAVQILTALGYRVVTPAERVCCGAPAFNNGDLSTARKLAEQTLEIFTALDVRAVLSPDATCGGAFQHEYELLFPPSSAWRQRYLAFREKVADLAEFLLAILAEQDLRGNNGTSAVFKHLPLSVTVHDSCHLRHLQHKADYPRQLLAHIPGLELVESPRTELCCGFGGSYSFLYPGESRAIARRKLKHLQQSGEKTIVVGSPGCLWKLRSEAVQLSLKLRIVHYLELLWEALLGDEPHSALSENFVTGLQVKPSQNDAGGNHLALRGSQ